MANMDAPVPVTVHKDALDYLISEHREFSVLFNQFFLSTVPTQRQEIVKTLVTRISQHASLEEQFIYPLMRDRLDHGEIINKRALMDDQVNKYVSYCSCPLHCSVVHVTLYVL
jgi:hemerythrin superfamily protein